VSKRFIILASGRGRNAAALMDYAQRNSHSMQIVGLVSDRLHAQALQEAKQRGIETFVIAAHDESAILHLLERLKPDWALLAGYKKKVGLPFLNFFKAKAENFFRVMNVHPSLLPAFPGLHGYAQAFRAGVKISGVTVHLVDQGIDTGLPILQMPLARLESDTLESFESRGLPLEHELYCRAMQLATEGHIHIKANPDGKGFYVCLGENQ
jgi:phosphoribosylglycinamide formyltransferase 1